MDSGTPRGVTPARAVVLALLAVGAFLTRTPWSQLGPLVSVLPGGHPFVGWMTSQQSLVATAGLGLVFVLVWVLVFVFLPGLYPARARELTTTSSFRVGVTTLTTVAAGLVFVALARRTLPMGFGALFVAALAVTVAVTSWTDNWRFSSPYVSPAFAVLASFVPTDRLTAFAALFRTAAVDPRTRVGCQALFGLVTVGFVLVVGTLVALPAFAFPVLELLVLASLAGVLARRLLGVCPLRWRLRWRRSTRRVRETTRHLQRLLTSLRGTAATLLVTSGFLLGGSVAVLAVAVAASAAQRTTSLGALRLSPSGLLAEWVVVGALVCYAATVGSFWLRIGRWLLVVTRSGRPRRTDETPHIAGQHDRPSGVLVPQALALIAAMLVLSPGALPDSNPLPALAATLSFTALSLTPQRVVDATPLSRAAALVPHVPDDLALPTAFAVQWLGISVAISTLPGTALTSVAPTTALVLAVALGGYFAADVRAELDRRRQVDVDLAYLVVLTAAVALLVWVTEQTVRSYLFG